jgi:hypothetical protein
MVTETWTTRELAVLAYLVEQFDDPETHKVELNEIESALGMCSTDVSRAVKALAEASPPYIEGPSVAEIRYPVYITNVSERARRQAGQWPTAESIADRLVAALNSAADREPDEEKRSWLRRTATWFAGAGRDFAVEVGGAIATRQMGNG